MNSSCSHEQMVKVDVLSGSGLLEARIGGRGLYESRSMNITAEACKACGAIVLRVTHPGFLRNQAEAQKEVKRP